MNMAETSIWKSKCELKLCPPLLVQRAVALALVASGSQYIRQ